MNSNYFQVVSCRNFGMEILFFFLHKYGNKKYVEMCQNKCRKINLII